MQLLYFHFGVIGPSSLAVDGNPSTDLPKVLCAYTRRTAQPWWGVDLEDVFNVALVKVLNTETHSTYGI